jgi:isopenicillin N synthase-like dioxygenase
MAEILYDEIPSLDLADFYGQDYNKKVKFVESLGQAYNNIGFVAIRNHFLTAQMQDEIYKSIIGFFQLPDEIKKKYEKPDRRPARIYRKGKGTCERTEHGRP